MPTYDCVLSFRLLCVVSRNDEMEDRYIVLVKFDSQESTDGFYKHFNGQTFSSLEVVFSTFFAPSICKVFQYLF